MDRLHGFQFSPPETDPSDLLASFPAYAPDEPGFGSGYAGLPLESLGSVYSQQGFPGGIGVNPLGVPNVVAMPTSPDGADHRAGAAPTAISLSARFLENYAYGISKKHNNSAVFLVQGGESPHRVTLELSLSSPPSFPVRVSLRLAYSDSDQPVLPETVSGVTLPPLTEWETGALPSVIFEPNSNLVRRLILKFNRLSRKNLFSLIVESDCKTFQCKLGPLMAGSRFDQSLDTFSDIWDGALQGAKGREEGKASRRIREAREARLAGQAGAASSISSSSSAGPGQQARERKQPRPVQHVVKQEAPIDIGSLQIINSPETAQPTFADDQDVVEPPEPLEPGLKAIVERAHFARLEGKLLTALQEANMLLKPPQWIPFATALSQMLREPNLKRIVMIAPGILSFWEQWKFLFRTQGPILSAEVVHGVLVELFAGVLTVSLSDIDLVASVAIGEGKRPSLGWASKGFTEEECQLIAFWSYPASLCLRSAQTLVEKKDPKWFYPLLPSEAAQRRLTGSPSGSFLLRLSSQAFPDEGAGLVTASFVKNDGVYHQRIPVLSTSPNLFASADEIITYIKSHPNRFKTVWMSPEELATKRVRGTEGKYFND